MAAVVADTYDIAKGDDVDEGGAVAWPHQRVVIVRSNTALRIDSESSNNSSMVSMVGCP
jgi:hypothetical protein